MRHAREELVSLSLQFRPRRLQPLTFDGVAHRSQNRTAIDLTLDQIVLRHVVHRVDGDRLVGESAEDNNRRRRRHGVQAIERFEARAVGQREIEQHEVDSVALQLIESL
jgi:hypothetical protein